MDLGDGQELLVIVTHLCGGTRNGPLRGLQIATLMEPWDGQKPVVIVGDMNARPDMPEMASFRDAGLKDAFAEVGSGKGGTFHAYAPRQRIDYIWLSANLAASDVVIPPETPSDHLSIVATLRLQSRSSADDTALREITAGLAASD